MRVIKFKIPKAFREPVFYIIAVIFLLPAMFLVSAIPESPQGDAPVTSRQGDAEDSSPTVPVAVIKETLPKPTKAPEKVEPVVKKSPPSTAETSKPTVPTNTCDTVAKNQAYENYQSALRREAAYHKSQLENIEDDFYLKIRSLFSNSAAKKALAREDDRHDDAVRRIKQQYRAALLKADCL